MKIVILDAIPANPGDLSWVPLAALGELKVYERTTPQEIAERLREADIVIINKVRLDAAAFDAASRLKFVSVTATGYDVVDMAAAKRHGVTVSNVPGYSTDSVAQAAIALLLELALRAGAHAAAVHAGDWSRQKDFCYWKFPLVELSGKTLAIAGMGTIGSRVGKIALALGMKIIGLQLPGRKPDTSRLPLEQGLPLADAVSLHCPLTPETRGMVNRDWLERMKRSAFLVNTSRGGLVNEADLAAALKAGRIAGYAADVLSVEPPPADHPLLGAPNCILTPHFAWATFEARARLLAATAENVKAFLAGNPQNVVS